MQFISVVNDDDIINALWASSDSNFKTSEKVFKLVMKKLLTAIVDEPKQRRIVLPIACHCLNVSKLSEENYRDFSVKLTEFVKDKKIPKSYDENGIDVEAEYMSTLAEDFNKKYFKKK